MAKICKKCGASQPNRKEICSECGYRMIKKKKINKAYIYITGVILLLISFEFLSTAFSINSVNNILGINLFKFNLLACIIPGIFTLASSILTFLNHKKDSFLLIAGFCAFAAILEKFIFIGVNLAGIHIITVIISIVHILLGLKRMAS